MTTEDLIIVILGVLSAGSAPVVNWLLDQILRWQLEDGNDIAPKWRRRIALALTVIVPTAMYALVDIMSDLVTYDWRQNFAYVVTAFTTSQILHGERKLPGTKEYEAIKVEEAQKELALAIVKEEGKL